MKFKFISFLMFLFAISIGVPSFGSSVIVDSDTIIGWNPGGNYDTEIVIPFLRCPPRRLMRTVTLYTSGYSSGFREEYAKRTTDDCATTSEFMCPNCVENTGLYDIVALYTCYCNAGYKVVNQNTSACRCAVCDNDTYSSSVSTTTSCTSCPQHKGMTGTSYTDHDNSGDCKYFAQCPKGQYGYNRSDFAGTDRGCTECPVALVEADGTEWRGTNNPPAYSSISSSNNTYTISSCKFGGSSKEYTDEFGKYVLETPCSGR